MSIRDEITGLLSLRSTSEKTRRWGNRTITKELRLLGARPHPFLARPVSYLAQHDVALGVLLLFNVILNLTDMTTSVVALDHGLSEGNSLVLGMSAMLGLNILGSLALMKALFITGAAAVALAGTRSRDRGTRKLMLGSLMTSAFIFLVLSLNNAYWILS